MLQSVQQLLYAVLANQFLGVVAQQLAQMGGNHRAAVDHGVTRGLGCIPVDGINPQGIQAKGGILGFHALDIAEHLARVDGQLPVRKDFTLTHGNTVDADPVLGGPQVEVVPDVHRVDQEAQFLGQFFPDPLDAAEQVTALVGIHQRNQAITHFQTDKVDRRDILPAQIRTAGFLHLMFLDFLNHHLFFQGLLFQEAGYGEQQGKGQKHQVGHAGHDAHQPDNAGGHKQHPGVGCQLPGDLGTHVLLTGHTGHDDRGGGGQQHGGNLRYQAVSDGQQHIVLGRGAGIEVVLQGTDGKTTDNVDEQNEDASHGVTADKLRGTVHRAVELGLSTDALPALDGFLLGNQTGIEVGIDSHLLAGHGVQGESRGYL